MWKQQNKEISIFDVKELYELAYAEKAKARCNLQRYRKLMRKAEKWDARYRAQLAPMQYQSK